MIARISLFAVSFFLFFVADMVVATNIAKAEDTSKPPRVLNMNLGVQWLGSDEVVHFTVETSQQERSEVAILTESGTRVEATSKQALMKQLSEHNGVSASLRDELRKASEKAAADDQGAELRESRSESSDQDTSIRFINLTPSAIDCYWIDMSGRATHYGTIAPGAKRDQHTFDGHLWMVANDAGEPLAYFRAEARQRTAEIKPHMKPLAKEHGQRRRERNRNAQRQLESGKYQVEIETSDVQIKPVHRIESSPKDGGRAILHSDPYLLPGEPMASHTVSFVNNESGETVSPFEEPFDFGRPRVRVIDETRFAVEKIDRGHQRFRLFVADAESGKVATVIDEKSDTFIWTMHGPPVPLVTYLDQSPRVIHACEKSGWRHLYLVDLNEPGSAKAITEGDWVVREIKAIDEAKEEIVFAASGVDGDQDPYLLKYYRVRFDGSGLVCLTPGNGTHEIVESPTKNFFIDRYSRVDMPPVHELRRASDGKLIAELTRADATALVESGWEAPEVISAKGRDGETDIWGILCKPQHFDPSKRYPVIEAIYAGPHDSHVPKTFRPSVWHRSLTDAGFIVVQIDGMGTANRSKAFHDVCWHNLKDAGFPDRISWMRQAAETRPYMDLDRVGIYGTSAGGQNAAGALIFHGDFYKAAAAFCGCHDNRMDKASWNEQWMGYPVGDHYAESSNIDNAHQLQGQLFLMVGELDTNVPPESTYRFADALIKAGIDFDYLVMPGVGHSNGGDYGRHRMENFFKRHLQPERISGPKFADLETLTPQHRIAPLLEFFEKDKGSLDRFYSIPFSMTSIERMERFGVAWMRAIDELKKRDLSPEEAESLADLERRVQRLVLAQQTHRETLEVLTRHAPFASQVIELFEARQRVDDWDAIELAGKCDGIVDRIRQANQAWRESSPSAQETEVLHSAMGVLQKHFSEWYGFFAEYDPLFTWWVAKPHTEATSQLNELAFAIEKSKRATGVNTHREAVSADAESKVSTSEAGTETSGIDIASIEITDADIVPVDDVIRYRGGRIAAWIDRFDKQHGELRQRHAGNGASGQATPDNGTVDKKRLEAFYREALQEFQSFDFDSLDRVDQVDWLLMERELNQKLNLASMEPEEENASALAQDDSGLVGEPVGLERIRLELHTAMIAYEPEELIRIAEREYEWCRQELVRASNEMGLGDDWQAAVEKVKQDHVEVGEQPILIRDLARESIEFLQSREMLSIPPISSEIYRMEMMTPKRQLINPFFTGGEVISVSYPTSTMRHQEKLQSMRGNNRHFSRATVHHELIPGHHMQGFMTERYYPHRARFYTPFWGEGWAVYWEMQLWDRGFARTPQERIGFLVWRAHRCARIIFSLNFHLGRMTPLECVDFLVANVGFDRNNATAEVRRSIGRLYSPLYQAGYMLGALQFRALYRELVDGGKMSAREFHDAVLRENYMPVELLRVILTDQPLRREFAPTWRFGDDD